MKGQELGYIYTFYSYKGGVGRSMSLANVATLLSQLGRRVLMVDFDLEAPGLERYFRGLGAIEQRQTKIGVVDLITSYAAKKPLDWRSGLIELSIDPPPTARNRKRTAVHLLSAGKRGMANDPKAVPWSDRHALEWNELFAKHDVGAYLKSLRDEWKRNYDIVLVDSRTGISDVGGICTIILPDVLVLLFTANSQSIEGCVEVVRLARIAQEKLPEERAKLVALPVLARDDRSTEYEQSRFWREEISKAMAEFFNDWLPKDVSASTVLQRLYLPHVPYWSFGERRPVAERPEELQDPSTLASAYSRLASLIDYHLNWNDFEKVVDAADKAAEKNEIRRLQNEARSLQAANSALETDVAEAQERARDLEERIMEVTAEQARAEQRARLQRLTLLVLATTMALIAVSAAFFLVRDPRFWEILRDPITFKKISAEVWPGIHLFIPLSGPRQG